MNKHIKILHVIHSLSGGGAETQLKLLANELVSKNASIAICCVNDIGKNTLDNKVQIYKSMRSNKYDYSIFKTLNMAIKQFKPDIVHAWLPASMTIPAMIIAGYNRIPCIFSYRNKMLFHRFLSYPEFVSALLFSDKIISNNSIENSNFFFRKLFNLKKGIKIPNSVYIPDIFNKNLNATHNTNRLNLLFVGRITAQKNWKCLIKAISLLDKSCSINLSICGDGEEMLYLKKMIKDLDLENQVDIKGFQSNIYEIMQNNDLLILPSFYEGMPNVLLEAMSICLPCIISDIPAHREIIKNKNAAIFFDPKCPDDLAKKIQIFFENKNYKSMIFEAENIAKNYSVEKMGNGYYRFYIAMLRKKS